ncbi:glutaredoxin domain-containing protein [Methylibium sp.]|uniref:glutaredoxin domain-containing protein n=1 Tax=Methylibium sp. TaxID=2067992 RepID=UPI003D098929
MSRSTAALLLGLAALGTSPALQAQYKIVEPDGRITYTDRPSPSAAAKVQPLRPSGGAAPTAGLPYELGQIAERYPVTLYSGNDCSGCVAGRNLLRQRGIPYTEKTVSGDADIAAFRQIEASSELPVLRIGGQQLRGYSEAEWRSYLDAAGYPKQSRLPADYRGWEPSPLVGQTTAPKPPPRPAPEPPAALPPALEAAPNGIRF